jgi:hypothetical protein
MYYPYCVSPIAVIGSHRAIVSVGCGAVVVRWERWLMGIKKPLTQLRIRGYCLGVIAIG